MAYVEGYVGVYEQRSGWYGIKVDDRDVRISASSFRTPEEAARYRDQLVASLGLVRHKMNFAEE